MSAPLRIAVDARMIRHSGIGVVLRRLLHAWCARASGDLFFFLCGDPDLIVPDIPPDLPARVIPWETPVYSIGAALAPPRLPADAAAWYAPHYATCLRTGLPTVCHIQDLLHITHSNRPGTSAFMAFHLAALRAKAAFSLVTTRHVKVQLQTLHHFRPSRVLLTSLGPGEVEEFTNNALPFPESVRRELGGEAPYLFATGILKPHKNWDFLLARLAANPSLRLPLVCAGLGERAGELQERARAAGVGDRVVLLPRLAPRELAAVYRHCSVFVYPSIAEGFGLPLLEALVMGAPAVHANLSPMKEIAAGEGFPFNLDWPHSFDDALATALQDRATVEQRQRRGSSFARAHQWGRTANLTLSAIRAAVDGVYPKWPLEEESTAPRSPRPSLIPPPA